MKSKSSKFVIYIITDLAGRNRIMSYQLEKIFTIFIASDLDSARNDLMDGVVQNIDLVLYFPELDGINIRKDIASLCQQKRLRSLLLDDKLCQQIFVNPTILLQR